AHVLPAVQSEDGHQPHGHRRAAESRHHPAHPQPQKRARHRLRPARPPPLLDRLQAERDPPRAGGREPERDGGVRSGGRPEPRPAALRPQHRRLQPLHLLDQRSDQRHQRHAHGRVAGRRGAAGGTRQTPRHRGQPGER
ncbi:hypothetical protein M9458_010191, partial [Cirrhinus mrigala]